MMFCSRPIQALPVTSDLKNIPKLYLMDTLCCKPIKPSNIPAVGAHKLGQMEFIGVFPFILTRIMPGLLSSSSAKADVG